MVHTNGWCNIFFSLPKMAAQEAQEAVDKEVEEKNICSLKIFYEERDRHGVDSGEWVSAVQTFQGLSLCSSSASGDQDL